MCISISIVDEEQAASVETVPVEATDDASERVKLLEDGRYVLDHDLLAIEQVG